MKILDARQLSVGVEEHLLIEHQGECYRRVAWYSDNASGYDWYVGKKRIPDPDWADDHEWDELFQIHYAVSSHTCCKHLYESGCQCCVNECPKSEETDAK
jgi:hypothetical protein